MSEHARHDAVHPAGEVAREILYRLAFAKPAFRAAEHDRPTAELPDRHFECHAGTQRRFLEDQGDGLALQRLREHCFRTELNGQAEQGLEILAPELAE